MTIILKDQTIYTDQPELLEEYENIKEPRTLPPSRQTLTVGLHIRRKDGTLLTYITGFVGRRIDLRKMENELEGVCHTCAESRMYDLVLKGDVRKRAYIYLRNNGYQVRFEDN